MSVLSDATIIDEVELCGLIKPFNIKQLQPASYDLKLGAMDNGKPFRIIYPREFMIASSEELVNIPDYLVARLEGKSSWARKGLIVHTAGFVDPGFRGQLTLEMTNLSNKPIPLDTGILICQIAFFKTDRPVERPYGHPDLGSHYQDQIGPTKSVLE
jgi:dCTP deaminase